MVQDKVTQFEIQRPSVFVVCSPFQVLCAIAAMRQLEIKDYLFFVRLSDGEVRNVQTEYILKQYGIQYTTFGWFSSKSWRFWIYVIRALRRKKNIYSRLFIGDFRDLYFHYVGCCYVSDGADVVYLDDGNITIAQLKGRYHDEIWGHHKILMSSISSRRNINFFKNVLTIYSDIPNTQYNIRALNLDSVVSRSDNNRQKKGVFIIGTVLDHYCEPLGVTETEFIYYLEYLFKKLKETYPKEDVFYIPHGRETKKYAEELCGQYDVIFNPLKVVVELELISIPYLPMAIYGFTSSALFNLKKLFPDTRVINILFDVEKDNPFYCEYLEYSMYYEQNGIETELVKLK